MLTSSLGDLSSHLFARNEELDDGPWQQIFDELCPTCNDPDALYDCKSCISRLYFEVAENRFNKNYDVAEEQVEKRNSYINSRRNRNSGCGCCIMSRFSNNFCCNVCHANRNG
ncbi:hypothetical protein PoB_007182400 [Plakobranchus ocellatus]|uniref:Uncharacterized protein n=1 Tax=Plakobranchus ocellatus TaxID=259542 RepID=A0AAV4DM99_9GAST|nr:hypothetical protein PoB_007182400 [Plakobranchus ocellatus]